LLLLRTAVGVTVIAQAGACLADGSRPALSTLAVVVMAVVGGVSLLIGFLTPVAGTASAVSSVLIAWDWVPFIHAHAPAAAFAEDRHIAVFVVIVAVAIVLLGPGASSLDAYLFGRREIIIPHESRSRRSES
jgi:hypothetical protein